MIKKGLDEYLKDKTTKELKARRAQAIQKITDKKKHALRISNPTKSRRDGINSYQLEKLQRQGGKFFKSAR